MNNIILNVVLVAILLSIAFGIALYLYKAKKRGQKCIGCPYAKQCSGKCGQNPPRGGEDSPAGK